MNRHAERRQHGQIPVHGVREKTLARNGEIIKAARAFADFIQTDEKFSAGEPCEDPAAQQALEVNDQVEMLRAQPPDAVEHFRPVRWFAPPLALEADDAREIGIACEQREQVRNSSTWSLTSNACCAAGSSRGSPGQKCSSVWMKSAKARAAFMISPFRAKVFLAHAVDWCLAVLPPLGVPVHKNFQWLPERPEISSEE